MKRIIKRFIHRHEVFIELLFIKFEEVNFLLFEQSLYVDNEYLASPRKLANVRRASHYGQNYRSYAPTVFGGTFIYDDALYKSFLVNEKNT